MSIKYFDHNRSRTHIIKFNRIKSTILDNSFCYFIDYHHRANCAKGAYCITEAMLLRIVNENIIDSFIPLEFAKMLFKISKLEEYL